ncbi:hypothetical protein DRQ12_03475 [candidate division KSB1 bacterium]|nr:MAG: hypothetical protein DRQ12_03475 [candidate division KSB1 bacterium]
MKKWQIGILIIIALVAVTFLYLRFGKPTGVNSEKIRTSTVTRGNISVTVSATGVIEPVNKVEVKSKASGLIEYLPVEEGDFVKKGQLIARLDQTDVKNDYKQAKANLQVAEAELKYMKAEWKRAQQLFEKGMMSDSDLSKQYLQYVQAKSQLVKARTSLSLAEERLKDTILKAPISGIILQKNVQAGQIIASGISNVTGGTLILTVADLNKVYVKASVDETDIGKVEKGQQVRVVADAFPEDTYYGKVLRIAPLAKVEQNVTTFEVTTEVDNPQIKLKAGMNATVEIILAEKRNVLLLPNEALHDPRALRPYFARSPAVPDSVRQQRRQLSITQMGAGRTNPDAIREAFRQRFANRKAVLVKRKGRFVAQMVEIGISNFEQTEIVHGLKEGDVVALQLPTAPSQATASSNRNRDLRRSMRFLGR